MQDVIQVLQTIVATGIKILDGGFLEGHTDQCPVVVVDVHWDQQQSQVEEVSTWTVVPPRAHLAEIIVSPLPGIGVSQLEEFRHEVGREIVALGPLFNGSINFVSIDQQLQVRIHHRIHQLLTASKAPELALGHHAASGAGEKASLRSCGLECGQHSAVLVFSAPAEVGVGLAVDAGSEQFQLLCCHEWGRGWSGSAVHNHFFVWFVEQVDDCSGTCPPGGLASRHRWLLAGGSGGVVARVGLKFKGHANCGVEAVLQGIASGCGARGWHGGGGRRVHGRRGRGVLGIVNCETGTAAEPLAAGDPARWVDLRGR
jgi:hypothetical protein